MPGSSREKDKKHSQDRSALSFSALKTNAPNDTARQRAADLDANLHNAETRLRRRASSQIEIDQRKFNPQHLQPQPPRPLPLGNSFDPRGLNDATRASWMSSNQNLSIKAFATKRPQLQLQIQHDFEKQIKLKLANDSFPLKPNEAAYLLDNPDFVRNLDTNLKTNLAQDSQFSVGMYEQYNAITAKDELDKENVSGNLIEQSTVNPVAMQFLTQQYGLTNTDNVVMAGFYSNIRGSQPQYAAVPVLGNSLAPMTPYGNLQMDNVFNSTVLKRGEMQKENFETYQELRREFKIDNLQLTSNNLRALTLMRVENTEDWKEFKEELGESAEAKYEDLLEDNEEKANRDEAYNDAVDDVVEMIENKIESQFAARNPMKSGGG